VSLHWKEMNRLRPFGNNYRKPEGEVYWASLWGGLHAHLFLCRAAQISNHQQNLLTPGWCASAGRLRPGRGAACAGRMKTGSTSCCATSAMPSTTPTAWTLLWRMCLKVHPCAPCSAKQKEFICLQSMDWKRVGLPMHCSFHNPTECYTTARC